ncbi:MAG: hypothetical protein ACKOF3_09755, partial [Spartobacteria bacterium]
MIITKKTCAAILIAALPVANSFAEEPPAKNSSWWQSWLSWLGVGQEEVQKAEPTKPLLFDFGTTTSALADGFTAVTPDSAWSPEAGFGWVDKPALTAVEKADLTKVKVRQNPKKPGMPDSVDEFPVFLNALSEDHVSGNATATFRVAAPKGAYK